MIAALERQQEYPGRDGARLRYRRAGEGGTPVLFLHGFSLGSVVWQRQLTTLPAHGIDAIALDLRGHGGSDSGDGPPGIRPTWSEDVAALVAHLGLDRLTVVAWSYGGVVLGDLLASPVASAIERIVMVAAAPLVDWDPGETTDPFFGLIPALIGADPADRAAAEATFVDRLSVTPLPGDVDGSIRDAVRSVDPAVRRALIERRVNHLDTYAAAGVPALLVHGDDDILMPTFVTGLVAERIAGAVVLRYEGVGHSPFLEAGDRFDRDLVSFIEGSVNANA